MASALAFSTNRFLNSRALLFPSVSSNPLVISKISTVSHLSTKDAGHHMKLKHPSRASAEGIPSELMDEDSKFVPLNAEDSAYGPPALLLLGFEVEEAVKIRELLKELDGEFLKVIFCTEYMIPRSLWEAMNTSQTNLETVKIAKSLPRICFLSGLSGEEMMMFIDAFPETGLEPAVFAALVPNSADKPLEELIEEIMGDHEMLKSWKDLTSRNKNLKIVIIFHSWVFLENMNTGEISTKCDEEVLNLKHRKWKSTEEIIFNVAFVICDKSSNELPLGFDKMHGFSIVDGFAEITESLAEMINYVANEPSVGLFYVQQHTRNAVPNVIRLKNNVVEKSRETNLHTEDLEDSITVVKSMKECGFPVADEMIRDIRTSLAILSAKQPRRGLINSPASGFQMGRTSSWGPGTWGRNGDDAKKDGKRTSNYFSTVFKSAKERASNFKWPPRDSKESTTIQVEKPLSYPNPSQLVGISSSSLPAAELDELPWSSLTADEQELDKEKDQDGVNSPPYNILLVTENHNDFQADKEAKLEEWLGRTADNQDKVQWSK
ncbi:hypothetical protein NC652_020324 [Populus alba x Populus x berolinensis]|nr:hypothetical protein NC652_020324 [Populus alba x Populus x berolinensis]